MAYERINWQNEPSEATALNDVNLNKMDSAIYELDGKATTTETAITALQDGKVDKVNGKGLSQVDDVTVTQHVAYGTVVSTIKTYGQDGTEVTSQVCNGIVVDSALSNSSTNPVQNKVVKSAIDGKSTVSISDTLETGTTLANITIDGTTTAIKGSDIEVDDELSPTSENPVENKAIYDALNNLLPSKTVSGNPISISDASGFNAKALKVTLNPIQDLHGYPNPWAGGAGKNKLDPSLFVDQSGWNRFTLALKPNTQYTASSNIPQDDLLFYFSDNETYGDSKHVYNNNPITITTDSTGYAHIQQRVGTSGYSFADYNLMVAEGTDTTFAPYSNICPISGRTEASVTRTGKNHVEITRTGSITSNGITWTVNSDETVTANGTATATAVFLLKQTDFGKDLQPNTEYIMSSGYGNNNVWFGFYYDNSSNWGVTVTNDGERTFTTISDFNYVRFGIRIGSGATVNNVTFKPMVRLSTISDSTFEPYQGETHTHQYSETIYGGVDDFVNGGLSNTFGRIDLSTIALLYQEEYGRFYSGSLASLAKRVTSNDVPPNFYCECYAPQALNSISGDAKVSASTSGSLFIYDSRFDNIEDFRTAMSGVYLYYELATPPTISTSAEEITLLKGNNVLSTNADDMELKYSVSLDSLLPTTTRTLAKSPIVEEPKEETDETEEQR